jgi:hypothetical protein
MTEHFETIERELQAACDSATDFGALEYRLERLIQKVEEARFATRYAQFGKQFTPKEQAAPANVLEAVEPPARRFEHGDKVRTKEGYLAYFGYYDGQNNAVVNVVSQAAEYRETDLTPSPL